MAEHRSRLLTHELRDPADLLRLRQTCQLRGEPAVTARCRGDGSAQRRADQAAQQRGHPGGARPGPDRRQIQSRGYEQWLRAAERRVEQCEPLGLRHGGHTGAGHPRQVGAAQLLAHAAFAPQAPGERGSGEAQTVAVVGQGVEEGVRRGVVGLPGGADEPGNGGVHDERGQVHAGGQLVEMERGLRLRAHHGVEAFRGERGDHTVVQDPGGVHDGGQRPVGGYGRQQRGDRGAVPGVAGLDAGLGSPLGQP